MSTFVILAAGRGTRIGRVGKNLHKALVPLSGRAVLSHLFDLAPPDSKVTICVGHKASQIKDYVAMAHPHKDVLFIEVPGWDKIGGGPGASLCAARNFIKGDLIFTSCDTLWTKDHALWSRKGSWAGVAPIPSGTHAERWCRIVSAGEGAIAVYDKEPVSNTHLLGQAYTGMAMIRHQDLECFWKGIDDAWLLGNEKQVTGGLKRLTHDGLLATQRIHWTDVGDKESYQLAVAKFSGYDWTKLDQATYILPEEGRVVKFMSDKKIIDDRVERARVLGSHVVPSDVISNNNMMSYKYVYGISGYNAIEKYGIDFLTSLIDWVKGFESYPYYSCDVKAATHQFYRDKTFERIELLKPHLGDIAADAIEFINWNMLAKDFKPAYIHGDLNFGNIIFQTDSTPSPQGEIIGIDWREDFAGHQWGDRRYDWAKLIGGCVVHWDRAQRGDFRIWEEYEKYSGILIEAFPGRDVQIIVGLSLLNSAPLHASPLDEILVARGAAILEECM